MPGAEGSADPMLSCGGLQWRGSCVGADTVREGKRRENSLRGGRESVTGDRKRCFKLVWKLRFKNRIGIALQKSYRICALKKGASKIV